MKALLGKIVNSAFFITGLALGVAASFLLITFLLSFFHIRLSLRPLSSQYSTAYTPPHPGRGIRMRIIRSKKPHHYTPNLPDLERITDLDRLKELLVKSLDNKEYYDAEEVLARIRVLNPDFPDIYWYTGLTLEGEDDQKGAAKAFVEYSKRAGTTPEKLIYIADFLIRQKDYKRAIIMLECAKKSGETIEICYLIARCHYLKGDCKKAEQYIAAAMKIDSNYPDVYELQAECCIRTGRTADAIKAFQEAYNLAPRPYFLYRAGTLAGSAGDYHTAKLYLNSYIDVEMDQEKKKEARDLLNSLRISFMRHIPSEVEQQRDFIPDVKIVGVVKTDSRCRALLVVNGANEEIQEGDSVLDDYFVLSINDSRVILIRDESYYVLKPL